PTALSTANAALSQRARILVARLQHEPEKDDKRDRRRGAKRQKRDAGDDQRGQRPIYAGAPAVQKLNADQPERIIRKRAKRGADRRSGKADHRRPSRRTARSTPRRTIERTPG